MNKLNALYNCVIKWRCLFYSNIFKSFTFRAIYLFVKITVTGQSFTIVTVRPNSIVAIIFNIFLCRWAILFNSVSQLDSAVRLYFNLDSRSISSFFSISPDNPVTAQYITEKYRSLASCYTQDHTQKKMSWKQFIAFS